MAQTIWRGSRGLWVAAMFAAGVAHQPAADGPMPSAAAAHKRAPPPSAQLSLADVMRRAHFSFREAGGAFTGGHATYESRVSEGAIELTAANAPASPFRLGATQVRRGDQLVSGRPSAPRRNVDGSVSVALGEVSEQLENTADGLEQRWHFARSPAGDGSLRVRVPVEADYEGCDAHGLRFQVGALAYRYSHATWVDADGARTNIQARWHDGAIELEVTSDVLERSRWPAVLDPLVSAEIALDSPTYVAAPNNQDTPAIAWSGTQYLAVWIDGRGPGAAQRDIYGARLSAGGAVLDPAGILISANAESAAGPAVASNGTDFMVVWTQSFGTDSFVAAARVTAGGVALDTTGQSVAYPGSLLGTDSVSIAWGSSSYLVVYGVVDSDPNSGCNGCAIDVQGVRIDQNRTPLGSTFPIGTGGTRQSPDVDWDGSNFLVVWRQTSAAPFGIAAARVSPAGSAGASFGIFATANPLNPSVAWNGSTHLVVWDNLVGGNQEIQGTRVPASGTSVTDATGFLISNAAGTQQSPDVTAAGSTFYVTWNDLRSGGADIYGAQVSGNMASPVGGTAVSTASGSQVWSAVASDGTNVMAVWGDYRNGSEDVYGTAINAAGVVQSAAGLLFSNAANTELTPAVSYDGTNYLVVWEDQRGTASDIYGARVSKTGTVLDANAIAISTAANNQKAPAVVFQGTNYLVVWQDERTSAGNYDIYGTRVTPAGAVLDASGIAINTSANSQQAPAVASDGTNALVVWHDDRVVASSNHIFGTRVTAAGAVLDGTGVALSAGTNREQRPALAWNGSTYLLTWENLNMGAGVYWEIYGRTVSNAMALGSKAVYGSSGSMFHRFHPAIGVNGATFLVAWEAVTNTDVDIIGVRVNSAGSIVGGQLNLATGSQIQNWPAVAGDGTNFQVVWQDGTNGTSNRNLIGRRVVASDGTLLDGSGFNISNGAADELSPALASSGTRSFLVAYQAFAIGANAPRTRARTLSNAPPSATAAAPSTNEDTPLGIVLTGVDPDGDTLTFATATNPTHGALSGTPPNLTYTPVLNYNGPDSFTFTVNDGIVDSAPATVSITVNAVNDLPVASPQSVSVQEDTPKAVTLGGSDVENSPLSYAVVVQPTHGSLSGSAPSLTYSPALNYNGPDSFTFKVNDGTADSATTATVTITVNAVNDLPVGTPQTLSTPEDTALGIVLSGTDVEGSTLTYAIVTQPPSGSLSGTPPNVTYTPNSNFNGTDSFSFKANDGTGDSAPALVTVIVSPVNDAPVAQSQSVGTPQDTQLSITLVATDIDLNALSYSIVSQPTHGTISAGSGASRTYTPTAGYQGSDSFTFKANDGTVDSNTATVNISVSSVNHVPVADAKSVSTNEDVALPITLTGSDSDNNPLTFTVTVPPLHGSLSGTGSSRTYTPSANYNGSDSFAFRVNDGQVDSSPATVSITVNAVNDAPTATGQNTSTQEDTPLALILTGGDIDGDSLTFTVTLQPGHGTLSGTAPNLTYTPAANYNGIDAFSFKANDGTIDSASAANVQILIAPVNDAPIATPQMVMTNQDTAKPIILSASDVDMDFLLYSIVTQPTRGTVQGTPPNVTYVPSANYRGTDSFTFKATDGQQDSAPATVSIAVASVNHAPVVTPLTVSVAEDSDAGITLTATDQDGDDVTFSVVEQPGHGTVTGTGPMFDYRPAPNYNGPDFFTVKGNDGFVDSTAARVSITVTPVNDAPIALMQEVSGTEDLPVTIVLAGSDVDGNTLSFTVASMPGHGSLSGNAPNLTFTPEANYSGDDSFSFTVNDGTVDSPPATVTVHVQPANDAPVADALTFTTSRDVPVEVTLQGSDVDGDGLTFEIVSQPQSGTLSGDGPNQVYTPNGGFTGSDSFTYRVSDGKAASQPARVTVTVSGDDQSVPKTTYARVNGWTCGCGQGGGGPMVLGGLLWLLVGRRRRANRAAVIALSVVAVAASAWAKPNAKKKSAPPPPAAVIDAPAPAPAVAPPPVVAAPPPAPVPQGPPTLAALEMQVTVPNEKLDNSAFTEMLVSSVDQTGLFKVISASEVATLLSVERQRQLLGCGEDSCLTEISEALGSQYLLQGTLGKVGENYLVTVRLLDSRRSSVVGRSSQQTSDVGLLLSLIWRGTQEVVDAAANNLPEAEKARWLARPRNEPTAAAPPPKVRFGVSATAVGGYQPLADPGYRASFGGEVALTLRVARFDLGAGVVVSPSPGGRISATIAVLATRSRVALGVRGVYFPVARLGGGGLVASYEFALNSIFGLRAMIAGEAYAGAPTLVLALLGGLGVEAHF